MKWKNNNYQYQANIIINIEKDKFRNRFYRHRNWPGSASNLWIYHSVTQGRNQFPIFDRNICSCSPLLLNVMFPSCSLSTYSPLPLCLLVSGLFLSYRHNKSLCSPRKGTSDPENLLLDVQWENWCRGKFKVSQYKLDKSRVGTLRLFV